MNWIKIILLFQAIVTLVIGLVFLSQIIITGISDMTNIQKSITAGEQPQDPLEKIEDIKTRFTVASYLLSIIGLTEIILILRLIS